MKTFSILSVLVGITGLLLFGVPAGEVWADGTEELGPPINITIAPGTGIVAAGTGLKDQPGTIDITIPAGATVKQVLLYWSGEFSVSDDNTVEVKVNGTMNMVTGTLIGGPTFFFPAGADYFVSAYRADITDLGLVNPGNNTLTVDGLEYVGKTGSDFEIGNHGAGVLVIIDEGGAQSDIDVRDGVDLAYCDFPDPRKAMVPQEYSFAPADEPRVADLAMFFGSTLGDDAPATRTNEIEIEVFEGNTSVGTTLVNPPNPLQSGDGLQWDTVVFPVVIPAGANRVVVEPMSTGEANICASFAWIGATLAVPSPAEECVGEIGDYVWLDDGDGCQEDDAGIANVTVCLYEIVDCDNPVADPEKVCTTTDEKGFYEFRNLECGKDYEIEFIRPDGLVETLPNQECEPGDPDESDKKDSDCVEDERVCVSLGEDTIVQDLTIDCGYVPECDISVDKTCEVIAPDPGLFECDDKVDALKMIWGGPGTLLNVTAYRGDVGDDETLPAVISTEVIDGVERQVVTVTGYQPSTNDVQWEWFSDGVPRSGISEFHLSCSDNEMNGPEDCGKPQGNGKSNDDALDNDWRLDGLTTDKGFVLDCTPELSAGAEECTIQSQIADCESIKALTGDKPDVLTWQYTGGGCDASDNSQDSGDLFCDEFNGGVDGSQAVTITDDDGNVFEVEPGGVFTTTRDASKVFTLVNDGGREDNGRHVSCSQPLIAGDVYGSLTLAALEGIGIGAEVRYVYEVTNNNAVEAITDISVVDDPLATSGVPGSPIAFLAPGASETLELTTFISQTTVNTVTVNGKVNDSPICEASDTVTVTVLDPPPCEVTIVFDKLEDDKIKWKITNVGGRMATLEEFVLDFPDSYGVIEKVKLDGDIYKASESSLVVGPGVPITKDDWTQSDVSKRQLDPGKTEDLEVEFSKKGDRSGWLGIDPVGGVNFAEGCEGKFPIVGGCALGDPTALIFEYTGDLCSATTNDQEGKFECEETGALGTLNSVAMTKDSDKISVEISGSKVTIFYDDPEGEKFPSEIEYKITGSTGTQSQTLHTSCSKQLNVGDQFGALILQEFVPED